MNYYGYVRVSTVTQGLKETSLEVQEAYLRKQAEDLGMNFILKREVESGKNLEGREVLTQLLKTLTQDEVLGVYDDSRLSRNTSDSIKIAAALANKGAKLQISGKFIDVDNPTDEFTYIINSAVAQYQRKIQNAKAKASIQLKRNRGDFICSSCFYGYELVKKRKKTIAVIKEDEARVIRYIHDAFQHNKSILSIAKAVGFNAVRVKDILVNPLYMGWFYLGNENKAKKPELITQDLLIKSNIYPAIIDENTYWNTLSKYKKFHKPRDYAYRQSVHVCSGVYRSACCGIGLVYGDYSGDLHYYATTNHRASCKSRKRYFVRVSDLELISQAIMLLTLKSGIEVAMFYAEQRNLLYGSVQEVKDKIDAKEMELAKNAKKLQRLVDLAAETDIGVDVFKEKITEIKKEEKDIKDEISILRITVAAQEGSIEELIEAENEDSIDEFLYGDNEQRRNFYMSHMKSAIVYEDRIEVQFTNLKQFVIEKRKTRSPKEIKSSFTMYFGGEEQAKGYIYLTDGHVEFIPVEGDDFVQYSNNYYKQLAAEVNKMILK